MVLKHVQRNGQFSVKNKASISLNFKKAKSRASNFVNQEMKPRGLAKVMKKKVTKLDVICNEASSVKNMKSKYLYTFLTINL